MKIFAGSVLFVLFLPFLLSGCFAACACVYFRVGWVLVLELLIEKEGEKKNGI